LDKRTLGGLRLVPLAVSWIESEFESEGDARELNLPNLEP
jgi:hypothetical protein